jgi:tetratricopeptide (TPR) repeat protein
MIGHPRFRTLERIADGSAADRDRGATKRHLASCARCRAEVAKLTRLSAAARLLPVPDPSPGGFDEVRRRIESGERLILPQRIAGATPRASDDAERAGRRRARRALAAAAAIVVIAAGTVLVSGVSRLEASDSTLEFSPARPSPGADIDVHYRSAGLMAGADRVILRARLRREDDTATGADPQHVVLDTLTRARDGTYRGTFRLPDGVAYAAFAIEDAAGERVDANDGRLWELSVHRPDGHPTYHALVERSADLRERNWELAYEVARELVQAYPDSVGAWLEFWLLEEQRTPQSGSAALQLRKQQEFDRLHALYAPRSTDAPRTAADLWYYAWSVSNVPMRAGDRAADNPDRAGTPMEFWRERVYAANSTDPRVLMVRSIYNVIDNLSEPGRGLAVADSLWQVAGPTGELTRDADLLARRSGNRAEVRRWLLRAVEADPAAAASAGRRLLDLGGYDADAVALLTRAAARLDSAADATRPLHTARSAHRDDIVIRRGRTLAELARGHRALGDADAARLALQEAAALPWDAALLNGLGNGLLALGDTAAAIRAFARLAADPLRSPAFADSVRNRVATVEDGRWAETVAAGRVEMTSRIGALADPRPLRSRTLMLQTADSRRLDLGTTAAGRFAVVSFWSRQCGYALNESPRLRSLQTELARRGIIHAVVAHKDSPAAVATALAEWHAEGLDVSYDVDGEVARAFNAWGTPDHYILDPRGMVRFRLRGAGRIDDVLRIITVLTESESIR